MRRSVFLLILTIALTGCSANAESKIPDGMSEQFFKDSKSVIAYMEEEFIKDKKFDRDSSARKKYDEYVTKYTLDRSYTASDEEWDVVAEIAGMTAAYSSHSESETDVFKEMFMKYLDAAKVKLEISR